ncbi:probable ribosome biogenesis protein AWC38_SpisGene12884 [Trichonephila clavipes]|nr:probable ribosome biogenesis protein AWC38_SpisGene12884 [Trichonephila clavipes]
MITSAGQAVVQIQYKDQINTETIYFGTCKSKHSFWSCEWLRNFQLDWSSIKAVQVENCNSRTNKLNILLQKYEKIFSPGIEKLEKFCCRLQMKPNYKPVFFKPRPVPVALKEKIETELNRLVAEDIIEPVRYSGWATPIVPVIKQNGNLRICGDYKVTINPGLKIEQYPFSPYRGHFC